MAIPASAYSTYGVGWPLAGTTATTREDAMNTLTMIDPDEAMTLAVLAKTSTNGLRHEWFTDTMQATATDGALQGEDWGVSNGKVLKTRTRLANVVQWFRQDWSITMDELLLSQRGQIFGVPDELRYQLGKAGQEVNRNIDARLWALNVGGGAFGYGSTIGGDLTAAQLATFRAWGSALGVTANQGSAQFGTAAFYSLAQAMWTAGAKPDTLFVSPGVKSNISRTLLGDTSYPVSQSVQIGIPAVVNAGVVGNGEYGPVIDFIRTDFGRVACVVDRWIPQQSVTANATDASKNGAYFLVEKSKLRVAFWRPVKPYQVASTGDNVKAYLLAAATVEVLHPTAIGHAYNVIS